MDDIFIAFVIFVLDGDAGNSPLLSQEDSLNKSRQVVITFSVL